MFKTKAKAAGGATLVQNGKRKKIEEPEIEIKEEIPTRSSPDSSTDPWGCPQCGQTHDNEARLVEHLLDEHQIRVVPPQSPSTTRCPVCRKHVADLSHHFALEHGEQGSTSPSAASMPSSGASLTRIIPIVLPSQPVAALQTQLESNGNKSGDLNNHVTIMPMRNYGNHQRGSSTGSSTPSSPAPNDNPVNLSLRKNDSSSVVNSAEEGSATYIAQAATQLGRKRRKQTHVPDNSKDERYWARRLKNNEAAKKSRDMRIRREKVIFEENVRLETMLKDLKSENDQLTTENKELHLKMGIILDENMRLKSLIPNH